MSKVIYHRHHVVPRHAGGTDDPSNMTCSLTIEEHAEHHRYRYEMLGEWQDLFAYRGLLGMLNKTEIIKESISHKGRRNPMYGKTGHKNPNFGKHHSSEVKHKISIAHSKKMANTEYRDIMRIRSEHARSCRTSSTPMLGKTHSVESRNKMSITKRKNKAANQFIRSSKTPP